MKNHILLDEIISIRLQGILNHRLWVVSDSDLLKFISEPDWIPRLLGGPQTTKRVVLDFIEAFEKEIRSSGHPDTQEVLNLPRDAKSFTLFRIGLLEIIARTTWLDVNIREARKWECYLKGKTVEINKPTSKNNLIVVARTLKNVSGAVDISDEDLKLTIRLLTPLVELISVLGPEYSLFRQDLTTKFWKLKDFPYFQS